MPCWAWLKLPECRKNSRSEEVARLNIGHFLIAEAVFSGLGIVLRECVNS